jgi:hypothetical protein
METCPVPSKKIIERETEIINAKNDLMAYKYACQRFFVAKAGSEKLMLENNQYLSGIPVSFKLLNPDGESVFAFISDEDKSKIEEQVYKSVFSDDYKTVQVEKVRKDSLISIEQDIAIGEIRFDITVNEFKEKKDAFLKKCKLPEYEYYKGLTFFTYKIGEYGFRDMSGWFHNEKLYDIKIHGPEVKYDEYNRVMPDQYNALVNILTKNMASRM